MDVATIPSRQVQGVKNGAIFMSTTDRSEYIDLIETKIESNSDQFCTRAAAAADVQ